MYIRWKHDTPRTLRAGQHQDAFNYKCCCSNFKLLASFIYMCSYFFPLSKHQYFFPASQHSGTIEDEKEEAEDEDTSEVRCFVCEKPFPDIDQWVQILLLMNSVLMNVNWGWNSLSINGVNGANIMWKTHGWRVSNRGVPRRPRGVPCEQ